MRGVGATVTQKKLCFLWFDDDEARVEKYRGAIENADFEGFRRASLEVIAVTGPVVDEIAPLEQRTRRPDLIIMDHIFSRARGATLKLNGASAAHLVRRIWPDVPIICVTAMLPGKPKKLDQEDLSEYIATYGYGALGDQLETAFAIATDFKLLLARRGNYRRQLVDRLKPPTVERESLMRALPSEFRSQTHATTQHRVARWVLGVLMERPGFLYDRIRAATLVGLSEVGFSKVENLFQPALYDGPFATICRPLWWVRELTQIVFAKSQDTSAGTAQLAGRSLEGIGSGDHSKCYVNAPPGDIPDVVARLAPSTEVHAVASKHTRRDPEDVAALPGFETLLVIGD